MEQNTLLTKDTEPPSKQLNSDERNRLFRRKYFKDITFSEWNNWRWQLKNRITNVRQLERIMTLTEDELDALSSHNGSIPLSITPYYASLIDPDNPMDPLRRTVVPLCAEHDLSPGEKTDPLGEDAVSPVPGIVHRYPDRVLFLVSNFCSTYCRYCTRSRMVGRSSSFSFKEKQWKIAIEYIEKTHSIRDVLLSGGDPLTLSDEKLHWLLAHLREIPHVEILRIGTKVPSVLPQRITPALVKILKRYHPLYLSIHFTHPDELTGETAAACKRLADGGIPLGSQTVLLSRINDNVDTLRRLFHGLLRIRVRPYYLYQCDPIVGSEHFRTPVSKGLKIMQALRGHTTGYAVPFYVIDAPEGGGKIPIFPETIIGRNNGNLLLKNYQDRIYEYPDSSMHKDGIPVYEEGAK